MLTEVWLTVITISFVWILSFIVMFYNIALPIFKEKYIEHLKSFHAHTA